MAVFAALCGLGTRTLTLNNITIPSRDEWTDKGGYYECEVPCPPITVNDDPMVDVDLTGNPETDKESLDAWSRITNIITTNGSLIIQTHYIPSESAFNIKLKVVR